jgi:toxin ParE1/3/4
MARVRLSHLAYDDLLEIWAFIAEDSAENADRFIDRLFETFELLANNEKLGKIRPELLSGLRSFPVRRYIIFYHPVNFGVEISRVLHSARDIENIIEQQTLSEE